MKTLRRVAPAAALSLGALGCPIPERAPPPGLPVATTATVDAGAEAR